MRIPGLGGESNPANWRGCGSIWLPVRFIHPCKQAVIDATEFVGPLNDLALGFYDIADYYYYPGWHEPGTVLEFVFNKEMFEALPGDLQLIMRTAAEAASSRMYKESIAQNTAALQTLVEEHNVELRQFPDDLTAELYSVSQDIINELGQSSEIGQRILDSYRQFEASARPYQDISIEAYNRIRGPATLSPFWLKYYLGIARVRPLSSMATNTNSPSATLVHSSPLTTWLTQASTKTRVELRPTPLIFV